MARSERTRHMTPRIALIGGQGWPLTETMAGLPALARRLFALGIETETFVHDARQVIRDYLWGHPWIGLVGDSLGAGAAALYAADQHPHSVQFVGGFQPSAYDPIGNGPLNHRVIVVPSNVQVAHCIWDPVFADTIGLGNARYIALSHKDTALTVTEHRGPHPDDWGFAQDLMVMHIQRALRNA